MNTKKNLLDYENIKADEFILNAWYTPVVTFENYKQYKECGFNYIFVQGEYINDNFADPNVIKALEYCDELGLKAFVCLDCADKTEGCFPDFEKCLCEFVKHESFVGFDYDEPVVYTNTINKRIGFYELSPHLARIHKNLPNVECIVNLNPTTSIQILDWGGKNTKMTYDEHLDAFEKYVGQVSADGTARNWLSCDDYVLKFDATADQKFFLKPSWLFNLEMLAERKRDSKIKYSTNFFIQAQAYEENLRVPTYNDLRLQMYTCMAFGYDSVSYYCYATPPYNKDFPVACDALVDRDNKKTQIWYDSQKLNREITSFANVYKHFNNQWIGVSQIYGTNNTTKDANYQNPSLSVRTPLVVSDLDGVKAITSTEDIIAGYMKDTLGNAGFMVVNYNDTTYNKTSVVKMTFDNANKALVYVDGVKQVVNLDDNVLTLNLDVGEGVFVIPYAE